MFVISGRIMNGEVVTEGKLEEGARVTLLLPEDDETPVVLCAELRACLQRSIEQAERGEWIDAHEWLEQRRQGRG